MGLRAYFGFGDRQAVEDRALTRDQVDGDGTYGTLAPSIFAATPGGSTVTPHNALAVADAYACVRALSDAAASLPLHVYRRTGDGRERLDNATAELLRNPAPAVTTSNLIGQLVAHLSLHGNAFIGLFRDRQRRVFQIGLLAPDRVAVASKGGRPVYTVTGGRGQQSQHGVEDIIHVKGMTTDGLVGLSPVRQCRVALGLSDQLAKHAEVFFANDATPRGLLKLQRFGDADAQVAQLRQGWEGDRVAGSANEFGTQRGTANAHRIAVVSGEVDFQAIGMPPDDAQFLESRQWSTVEIARVFRLPPWIVGASSGDSMTYANVSEQALAFVTYSLRPVLVSIEQALSASRELFDDRTYCEFGLEGLLRGSSEARASFYTAALSAETGWMSREEVRRLENLPAERDQADPTPPVAPAREPERLGRPRAVEAVPVAANGNGGPPEAS